jgi:hypothetical protein
MRRIGGGLAPRSKVVMPGLVPGILGRDKPGHDESERSDSQDKSQSLMVRRASSRQRPCAVRRASRTKSPRALVDRLARHRREFAHRAIGHLPGYGYLAVAFELLDRGLGLGADGAGRFQLAISVFRQRALHRRDAA